MKQAVILRLIAVLTVLLLSACQTGTPVRKQATPPLTDTPAATPLRVAKVGAPAERAALEYVVESYKKSHPDRPVELVDVIFGSGMADMTAADGGELDIIPFLGSASRGRGLLDLMPYAVTTRFDEAVYGNLLARRSEMGSLYGVPITTSPYMIAINVDAFEGAGVPILADGWTWEAFRVVLANLKRAYDRPAFEVMLSYNLMQIYIEQLTGRPIGEADEKDVANAVAYFDTLVNQDQSLAPTPVLTSQGIVMDYRSFQQQQTSVSFQEYRSGVSPYYEFKWQYLPVPSFKPGYRLTTTVAYSLGVSSKTTKEPALAWDFLQFAASDEIAVGLAAQGIMPARVAETVREAVVASAKPGSPLETLIKMQVTAQVQDHNQGRYTSSTFRAGDLIMSGQATADEVMAKCREQRAKEALSRP